MYHPIQIGKFAGKTLPQLIFSDPDYFFWAYENEIFDGEVEDEADDLYKKAISIRVPQKNGEEMEVEYLVHPTVNKLADVQAVPKTQPVHRGSSPAIRRDVFDLSFPHQIAKFDKLGGKILISRMKAILFGDPRMKLTKKRCEAFFENNENFKLHDR